jgi:hypothetical protein
MADRGLDGAHKHGIVDSFDQDLNPLAVHDAFHGGDG